MTDGTRPHDSNRVEFDWCGERTMTDVIRALLDDAFEREELARWATATESPFVEVECPLCGMTTRPNEIIDHVGSYACSRNLLDLAIIRVITEPAEVDA